MDFDEAYQAFIKKHYEARNPIQARRLRHGLQFAEKTFLEEVWWPAFQSFDALHPEYEVRDFKDGYRYIDFAYIQPGFRLAIEIDGFGPHSKDTTPEQFSDNLIRQDHLVIDRWNILRFAATTVKDHPRVCQQIVQQLIGRLTSDLSQPHDKLSLADREIVHLVINLDRPVNSTDVMNGIGVSRLTARRHLKGLVEQGWLVPTKHKTRIHYYRLSSGRTPAQL
ncbi:winged helix-turn-helix domain-containing protein [Alicyclobacillus mengziensis]|uniref:DNA-binding response regulator n=1 Tax=Alicyclobacillus mengziensis TaxID=2931921 RepID=A0A9X7Z6S8_9BACL|nr:winged helix-turn-helix domain-containing protein [Alicyclobacillus mengziensis]QSO47687.1 DNA-binding response regulator [Alicyclobacillus mengziensis]